MAQLIEFPTNEKRLRNTIEHKVQEVLREVGAAPETAKKILDVVLSIYDKHDEPVPFKMEFILPKDIPPGVPEQIQRGISSAYGKVWEKHMELKLSAYVDLAISMIRLFFRER
mgnify:CR=1 FL=1